MTKYLIEGDINFYDELNKMLDVNDDTSEGNDCCLITQKPLENNNVTLVCGHKFNYNAIFHDILNHKKKFNSMERHLLKNIEIRCPYCRIIQKKVLPYVEGYPKVHGVNYIDESINYYSGSSRSYMNNGFTKGECSYINENGILCPGKYVKLVLLDNKYYCACHYQMIIKKIIKEKAMKIKEEKMKAKLEEKEKKKAEKEKKNAEKEKIKSEKMALKESKKLAEIKCIQILKSGINKGTQCKCKAVFGEYCSRHATKNKLETPDSKNESDNLKI